MKIRNILNWSVYTHSMYLRQQKNDIGDYIS